MKAAGPTLIVFLLGLLLPDTRLSAQQEIPSAMHGAEMRWLPTLFVLAEKLEFGPNAAGRPVAVDAIGWYGGARNRIWARAEADFSTTGKAGETQLELLYGRLITPFFDALIGVRVDHSYGEANATRGLLAVGVEGLAPNWFELETSAFLSQDGDLSARLTAAYDLLFTQRLILEPRLELNASARRVPEFGLGSGLTDIELGGRMRYEIRRKFAPYGGFNWHRQVGSTADFARAAGESPSQTTVVVGLRVWY